MKQERTFYVIKNLYAGLFWSGNSWVIPKTVEEVLGLPHWDSFEEAQTLLEESQTLLNNTEFEVMGFGEDVVVSTITIQANIIF